jgi:hypothetical protein
MSNTKQIAIIAAVGIGAFLFLRTSRAQQNAAAVYPYGRQAPAPTPGTAAYAQWQAAQTNAQLEQAKLGALYGIGKMVNGWFGGGSNAGPGAGGMTGTVRPSTDYGTGIYMPPDTFVANPPYTITYADQTGSNIDGADPVSSADSAFLHSNDGYGFYTQ